jgi:hypothetical protein
MTSLRDRLGIASRNLLTAAFAREGQSYSARLATAAIARVADTFLTSPDASRQLLKQVFLPERFVQYGHVEVPSVAATISVLGVVDPDFAVSLYFEVFSRTITSTKLTSLTKSSIISMHSDAAQDYDLARTHLTQYYPILLEEDFERGVRATILAIEGYATLENDRRLGSSLEQDDDSGLTEALEDLLSETETVPTDELDDESDMAVALSPVLKERETNWTRIEGGATLRFSEDHSCGWAWDPDYIHHDGALSILQRFVNWLGSSPAEQARAAVRLIFTTNHVAVIWSRLFMVAAKRPEVFADLLWPIVTDERVIQSLDMGKDAIDAIAAFYPSRTNDECRTFEQQALEFDFSTYTMPDRMRADQLSKLFTAIGDHNLVTDEAKTYLASLKEDEVSPNDRPITITGGPSRMPEHWWLAQQGVDVESPEIVAILAHSKRSQAALGWQGVQPPKKVDDIDGALTILRELEAAMDASQAEGVPDEVLRVPADVLARACTAVLTSISADVAGAREQLSFVQEMALRLCSSPYPLGGVDAEANFEDSLMLGLPAARAAAADNVVLLCSIRKSHDENLEAAFEALTRDTHPAIRSIAAKNVATLSVWGAAKMWSFVEKIAASETNSAVLRGLVNGSLARVWDWDPAETERLLLSLQKRLDTTLSRRKTQEGVRGDTAALLAMLYVWNDCKAAGETLRAWCSDAKEREIELHSVLYAIRDALILGYAKDTPRDRSIRQRSQELVSLVVDSTATGLLVFPTLEKSERVERAHEERALAKNLNQASSQIYFASGAFEEMRVREHRGLKSDAEKAAFLAEVGPLLRRLGDVGTPAVIYQLLQVLEFLLPASPEECFDLVSHALLDGGRRNGYEFESMNADIFVKFVAKCLADYRSIFRDERRRQNLIDSLDAFIEAGWPSARRLMFELPRLIE